VGGWRECVGKQVGGKEKEKRFVCESRWIKTQEGGVGRQKREFVSHGGGGSQSPGMRIGGRETLEVQSGPVDGHARVAPTGWR